MAEDEVVAHEGQPGAGGGIGEQPDPVVGAARDRSGKLVAEAFMVRFHPQWRRAKALVDAGEIGAAKAIQTFFCYRLLDPANVQILFADLQPANEPPR